MSTKVPSKVIGIQFSTLSPEQIRRASVANITSRDTYINNKPCIGGIFDPRMGVLEPGLLCPTDGLNYMETPGYFGHMELAKPVYYLQYLTHIIKTLKCICLKCSKVRISKEEHKHILSLSYKSRFEKVLEYASKVKECGEGDCNNECNETLPTKIKKDGFSTLYAQWINKNKIIVKEMKLTPEIISKIFRRITNEDCEFMGFSALYSRPEWMICEVLAIPPPCVRPSVKHDAQQRSEDDLSHIIIGIMKANKQLEDKLNQEDVDEGVINDLTTYLQYYVATLVNNKIPGVDSVAQRSGRVLKSITDRLNGKGGRIRGNLMGKRVDFSARSVITADPNLSISELGVPIKIAMNITYPEVVNNRNINQLRQYLINGPDKYPGAKVLERYEGDNISLKYVDRDSIQLNIGDTLHRHMLDGDAVLFNRQPTLHRMSMMCHKVRVLHQGNTFRMNVADTKPYNADFDGDEMNMHMPQDADSVSELRNLAAVPRQILSPATNSSIIGIFQDSLLGLFRFTRENIAFNPKYAMNLLANVKKRQFRKKNIMTSHEILSNVLPPLSTNMKNGMFSDNEDKKTSNNVVEIVNGNMIRGQLDKGVKHLIHSIFNDFGFQSSSDFIDGLQNIVTEYMKTSSFSVGISDLIANNETNAKIDEVIGTRVKKVNELIYETQIGTFINNTSRSNEEEFETRVNGILNDAREEAGSVGRKSLDKDNRFVIMVNAGSKGNNINISQMISCLGQQNIDNKRISYGFQNRALPHFQQFDDSPEARGFINNSFIDGLTPQQLFMHGQSGRVGLIDTAVKTASTGYLQRKLVKGLEDIKVEYDMTVRNNNGQIIQYTYGDDSVDTTKSEKQQIPLVEMTIEEIYSHYQIPADNLDDDLYVQTFTGTAMKKLKTQTDEFNKHMEKRIKESVVVRNIIVQNIFNFNNNSTVYVPVHFKRIVFNIKNQLKLKSQTLVNITPLECYKLIEKCKKDLQDIQLCKPTQLFFVLMDYYTTPQELLIKHRFTKHGIELLCMAIKSYYIKSIVTPGEMVGMIAAQSIGEPTTQMTLNTFHFAGVSSKSNVTRGVPRIEEILHLSKIPKSSSTTIYMHAEEQTNLEKAQQIQYIVENTCLRDIILDSSIYFDPDRLNTLIHMDKELMEQYAEFEKVMDYCTNKEDNDNDNDNTLSENDSKFIIRLELDKELMLEKNISMDDIHFSIKTGFNEDVECVFSDYNSDKLVFRIRILNMMKKKTGRYKPKVHSLDQSDAIHTLVDIESCILDNIILKGVKDIGKVYLRKIKTDVVEENNSFVSKDIWVLDTVGTNLMKVLSLDMVDKVRTYSNNIHEIYDVLGIEAARQSIYREIMEVLEFDGSYINSHHVSLLSDRMCVSKKLISMSRHGTNQDNIGPIAKASYEETGEVFLNAAAFGEIDKLRGVSANVMCGQYGYFGTSSFKVCMDVNELSKMKHQTTNNEDVTNVMLNEMMNNHSEIPSNEVCSIHNIEIKNNIDNIKGEELNNEDMNVDYNIF
jgi:DNA-directed RNA polymerase II subunit RPB1